MSYMPLTNPAENKENDVTKGSKMLHIIERNEQGLTQHQQQATELLALGKSKTEVAAAIGVSRQQLHRWDKNVYFRSAVSMTHAELWKENRERLRGLAGKAVAVIENEIDGGSLKAAVELLKIIGMSQGKVALTKNGKSVEELLEIEAAKQADAYMRTLDRPNTTQDVFSRELVERPALIRSNLLRLKAMTKPPEDEAGEILPEEEEQ